MPTRIRHAHAAVLAVALAAVGLASWRAGASSSAIAAAPTAVGVVNVEKILNGLDELTQKNAELKSRVEERQKDLDDLVKQMDNLKAKLDEIPREQEDQRRTVRAQLYELQAVAASRKDVYQSLINIEKGEILKPLYDKLALAVGEVADKEGYDVVLFDDRGMQVPDDVDRVVNAAIQGKKVLYASTQIDLSDQVITLMNNKFKTGSN